MFGKYNLNQDISTAFCNGTSAFQSSVSSLYLLHSGDHRLYLHAGKRRFYRLGYPVEIGYHGKRLCYRIVLEYRNKVEVPVIPQRADILGAPASASFVDTAITTGR